MLIQEKLEGQEFGLDVINDLEGNYRTTIVKQKTAMRSGETDEAMTVENAELVKIGGVLARALGHRGNLDGCICLRREILCSGNERPLWGRISLQPCGRGKSALCIGEMGAGETVPESCLTAKAGVRALKDIQMLVWSDIG